MWGSVCVCVLCVCVIFVSDFVVLDFVAETEKKLKRSRRTCSTRWVHVAFWMSSKWKLLHSHKCGKCVWQVRVHMCVCCRYHCHSFGIWQSAQAHISITRQLCQTHKWQLRCGNWQLATGSGNWHILRLIWFPFKCRYKWPVIFMLRQGKGGHGAQQWSSWSRWGSWAAVNSLILKAFHLHFAHLCCCHWKFCRGRQGQEGSPFYCFAIIPGELCVCRFLWPQRSVLNFWSASCAGSPALIRLCF